MTRKVFNDGMVLPAEDVNAIAYPFLDGQPFIGHGDKITDLSLSDEENQLKANFYRWYNRFKPSVLSGTEITISSGIVQVGGTLISIPQQSVILANDVSRYIYIGSTPVDNAIALRIVPSVPTFNHVPVAWVITSNGTVTVLNDIRQMMAEFIFNPPVEDKLIHVGDCIFSFSILPPPTGYFECLHQPISRTIYSKLFEIIGVSHGEGDGLTTFNLPEMRDYCPRGGETPGVTSGNDYILVTTENLPSHLHSIDDSNHSHSISHIPHNHELNQSPHNHGVIDPQHQHGMYGWLYDTDAGEGSDGDGSAYRPMSNTTYFTATNISLQPAIADISIAPSTASGSVNPSSSGINSTRNTGSNSPLDIRPKSKSLRCFIKY